MINFFIVEDNENFALQIDNNIRLFFLQKYPEIKINIHLYASNFTDIYDNIDPNNVNVYFIDIALKKHNGIKLAEQIRQKNPQGYIIFITAYPEFLYKIVKMRLCILDLISKYDDVQKEIWEDLQYIVNEMNKNKTTIGFRIGDEIFYFPHDSIIMFEACKSRKKTKIYTTQGVFEVNLILKQIYPMVQEFGFIRIHKGYIINPKHIEHIDPRTQQVRLKNNLVSFYSRKFWIPQNILKNSTF